MDSKMKTILKSVLKPGRYTGGEYGQVIKDKNTVKARFAFCFPDTYEIGMSNLGVRLLYGVLKQKRQCDSVGHGQKIRMDTDGQNVDDKQSVRRKPALSAADKITVQRRQHKPLRAERGVPERALQ